MPNPQHVEQINEAIRTSLRSAGIPLSYHDKRLTNFGDTGAAIEEWFTTNGVTSIHGAAFNIVSSGYLGRDLAFVVARGLHLSKQKVRATSLPELTRLLQKQDSERFEDLCSARVLLMTSFFLEFGTREAPLNTYQTIDLQEFLLDRLAQGGGLILSGTRKLGHMKEGSWWTQDFLQQLTKVTKEWSI